MKKFLLSLFFMLLPAFFLLPTTYANTTAESLTYITEEFRPFNYQEGGAVTGFSVELLRLMWQEMDVKPQKIRVYPWARGYNWLQKRPNVVLFSTGRTEQREALFQWVCPIGEQVRNIFLAKKSRNLKIRTLDDAKKYRIGTVHEDVSEQTILKKGFKRSQLKPMPDMKSNLKKLLLERIDLVTYDEKALFGLIDHYNMNRDDFETAYLISQTGLCYAFNKEIPVSLVNDFQLALNKVLKTKAYRALEKKYGMNN